MTIVHIKLGKITKRSDGRYQAGYRDVDGKRKFITCNSEEEVLERSRRLSWHWRRSRNPKKSEGDPKRTTRSKRS